MQGFDATRRKLLSALAIGASLACAMPAMAQPTPGVTDKEIKLGTWMPLTGPVAPYGIPQRAGIEAYLSMINERGGIKGRKLSVIVEDNGFSPQRTSAAARKLIANDEVLAIVTPNGTAQSAATFEYVLGEAKVPIVNLYGGAPDWFSPPRENLYGAAPLPEA